MEYVYIPINTNGYNRIRAATFDLAAALSVYLRLLFDGHRYPDIILKKTNTMQGIALLLIVQRLQTYEIGDTKTQEAQAQAAEHVLDKLRAHLSKSIGKEGFRTLLARALVLTLPQYSQLANVRIEADGSFSGLPATTNPISQELGNSSAQQDFVPAILAVTTQLLDLLMILIGEELTLRILGAVWPSIAFDDAAGRKK